MAVVNKQSFVLANAPKKRGPLVRVEISPGRYVKMYQEDAIASGYITPAPGVAQGPKSRPAAENKMRLAAEDKATPTPQRGEQGPEPDDFTAIRGIGPATARLLATRGITTFEQLRQAGTLDYLSPQATAAIETWRQSG
jgi:predicted flap endonuclease-1-like 5' DNA nuclease